MDISRDAQSVLWRLCSPDMSLSSPRSISAILSMFLSSASVHLHFRWHDRERWKAVQPSFTTPAHLNSWHLGCEFSVDFSMKNLTWRMVGPSIDRPLNDPALSTYSLQQNISFSSPSMSAQPSSWSLFMQIAVLLCSPSLAPGYLPPWVSYASRPCDASCNHHALLPLRSTSRLSCSFLGSHSTWGQRPLPGQISCL